MRKILISAFALVASFAMVACDNGSTNTTNTPPTSDLVGEITSDITLERNKEYTLSGPYIVKAGATLHIEEGVTIIAQDDDIADYILIEQGAKINAVGTASNPIIMTSTNKEAGAWGGLHICGYASTNSGIGKSEIGNASYGGSNDSDNSGVIKFVRLEYTGFAFDEEHESNGISFYGVGNGTEVSYVQAYRGSDDGLEFFGGTVNVKYAVVTSCSDDSFDWTDGWRGKAQFLVAYHENEATLNYVCDCLFECDNNGDNNSASPSSHPVISNVTLVGNNSTTKKDGVMLKAGTQISLHNAIITGKVYDIYSKTTVTENALKDGVSKLENIATTSELYAKEGIYSNAMFLANTSNSNGYVNALTGGYVGIVAGGSTPSDSFFTTANYKGAIDPSNDWTQGWTIAPVL